MGTPTRTRATTPRLTTTKTITRAGLVLSALIVIATPTFAFADGTTDAVALKDFDAGRAAYDRGEMAAALASFQSSMQALPSPNTRLYIARCQRGLGKIGSAFTSYKLAAREASDRLNATGEKRYAATKEAAVAEAAEIEKSVPHLTVNLPVDAPPVTSVKLDDVELPRSALSSLDVDPGPHKLRVTAPRRTTFEQKIELAQAEQKVVEVAMPRLPTATVQVVFKAKPAGVAVEIDGKAVDPSRVDQFQELDTGAHKLIVRAPGYRDFEWKDTLADGDSRKVDVVLEPGSSGAGESHGTPKWLFFGVAAISVVALGVGTYFALDATSRANDEKAKDPLTRDPAEQDKVRSEATTANVLFIAGAAIAGGAGALAFITDWKGKDSAPPAKVNVGTRGRPVAKSGIDIRPWVGVFGAGAKGSF